MESDFSWGAYGDDLRRQRELQAAHDQARRDAEAAAVQYGRKQRLLVATTIVQPFLTAMHQAGNPGARLLRKWRYGSGPFCHCVHVSGDWMIGLNASRVSGYQYAENDPTPGWRFTPHFRSDEIVYLQDSDVRKFRDWLVFLMRSHNVTLPSD